MRTIIYITLFVVVFSSVQEKIYLNAKANVGETVWAYEVDRQAKKNPKVYFTGNEWKCNLFVYEMILDSGYDIGTPNTAGFKHLILFFQGKNKRPPCCMDWYNEKVPGFILIGEGEEGKQNCIPGDIVTDGTHMGIIAGNEQTISAAYDEVVENDWGYRGNEKRTLKYFRYNLN